VPLRISEWDDDCSFAIDPRAKGLRLGTEHPNINDSKRNGAHRRDGMIRRWACIYAFDQPPASFTIPRGKVRGRDNPALTDSGGSEGRGLVLAGETQNDCRIAVDGVADGLWGRRGRRSKSPRLGANGFLVALPAFGHRAPPPSLSSCGGDPRSSGPLRSGGVASIPPSLAQPMGQIATHRLWEPIGHSRAIERFLPQLLCFVRRSTVRETRDCLGGCLRPTLNVVRRDGWKWYRFAP
jgi:hypothetical protein